MIDGSHWTERGREIEVQIQFLQPTQGDIGKLTIDIPDESTVLMNLAKVADSSAFTYAYGDDSRISDPVWSLFSALSVLAELSKIAALEKERTRQETSTDA